MKKIFNWIRNLGIGILLILTILSLGSRFKKSEYILDFAPMKVLSGSMEPKLKAGDIIIARKIDPKDIKEGDIVTYKLENRVNVTHRVVEVFNTHKNVSFKTKGDANNIEDSDLVLGEDLVGKLALRIPKFGYFIDWVTTPLGFGILFILPVIILLSKEVLVYMR